MGMKSPVAPVPHITIQAFWEDESTRALLFKTAEDPRLSRVQMSTVQGGLAEALKIFQSAPTPNLILIESRSSHEIMLEQLDALAEFCDETTRVIIIGHVNDVQLYRQLIARGISDYLVHPFEAADLVRIIAGLYADPSQRMVGRVIAVTGTKGGCGTSTIAHNLATMIARDLRQSTILIDFDIPFGTAGLNFNQEPEKTLSDAVEAVDRIDSVFVERLLTKCEERLHILASPALVEETRDMAANIFDPVLDGARMLAPFIILDLPHGWPEWKRRLILNAEEVVLVSEPDLASLRNAKNLVNFICKMRPNDLFPRLVLNKANMARRPEISSADFEHALAVTPLVTIPHNAKLFGTAANNGQVLADVEGSEKIINMINCISKIVTGMTPHEPQRLRFIAPIVERLRNAVA